MHYVHLQASTSLTSTVKKQQQKWMTIRTSEEFNVKECNLHFTVKAIP